MPASWLLCGAALPGGVLIAAQGPVYARLSALLGGNALLAAFIAFGVATCMLGLALLATQPGLPTAARLAGLPWWVWLGGVFGVYQVLISMHAVPQLGVTLFIMLVVAGNLGGAIIIDQFGWFGLPRQQVGPGGIVGVILMVAGIYLTASRQ